MAHVSSGGEREGGGGLVPRGPGQLWGPGPSWIFFLWIGQWRIQGGVCVCVGGVDRGDHPRLELVPILKT